MPDPTPQILEAAGRFRQQLLARERRAASAMVRYYGDTWGRLQPEIRRLRAEVEEMRTAGEDVSHNGVQRLERLESIRDQAQMELLQFAEYADGAVRGAQREAIAAAERDAPTLMRAAYPTDAPITIRFDRMPREAVEKLVGFLQDGSPLKDLLDEAVGAAVDDFASTMVTGMAAGWNPRRLAQALRSEFGMGLTRALRISRTEQLKAYRATSLNAYRTSNVCTGWEWLATLSPRTCMACLEKDGTRYPLSAEFEDHVQGRCCPAPITKSYAEMGIDAPEPDFTREKGHDWFLRQDEATQRGMMKALYDPWKDGQFALGDIPKLTKSSVWGNSWTPKTLGELVPEAEKVAPWAKLTIASEHPNLSLNRDFEVAIDTRCRMDSELAKSQAMKSLARRLEDDQDFRRLAPDLVYPEYAWGETDVEKGVSYLVSQWGVTSGDDDRLSVAMQQAIRDEFGVSGWTWSDDVLRRVRETYDENDMRALQKFVRAMYDESQAYLESQGIESLWMYRGMAIERRPGFEKVLLDMQPASSFSTRYRGARDFAFERGKMNAVIVGTEVPRERILGFPTTGYGCLGEYEVVVLGGKTECWALTNPLGVSSMVDEWGFQEHMTSWVAGA